MIPTMTYRTKVAIDFEYNSNDDFDINYLICAATHTSDGDDRKFWLRDGRDTAALIEYINSFDRQTTVFVSHALELAEALCFEKLGLNPIDYIWRDTWTECRWLANTLGPTPWTTYSLAEACRLLLKKEIDTSHKEAMRQLCINGMTAGHEDEIMDYCLTDVADLLRLADMLEERIDAKLSYSIDIDRDIINSDRTVTRADRPHIQKTLARMAHVILCFHEIAQRGLPVNVGRCMRVKERAPQAILDTQREFSKRFPRTFDVRKSKAGTLDGYKMNRKEIQKRISDELRARGVFSQYPKDSQGQPVLESKTLGEYFSSKDLSTFGGSYLHMQNEITAIRGVAGIGKKSWWKTLDKGAGRLMYRTLRPLGACTGRCQPKTSQGFVPGWSKWLFGILEPPEGKWLVELDYSAEETALMAAITGDSNYRDVYNAKDTYMWFCDKLGLIPHEDYVNLDKSELKAKYADLRQQIKRFSLAWGYGAGAMKLASIAKIDVQKAKEWKRQLDEEIFAQSFRWKQLLSYSVMDPRQNAIMTRDGWSVFVKDSKRNRLYSKSSMINWPFQGTGAAILRFLVVWMHNHRIECVATIHDAVMFLVDEGDTATIDEVRQAMASIADRIVGENGLIKVGEADIIRHGEIWAPEQKFVDRFLEFIGEKDHD